MLVLQQIAAVQGALAQASKHLIRNHLETCVSHAVDEGRTLEVVDELMEVMKYTAAVTGPAPTLEKI